MSDTEKILLGFALGLIGTTAGAVINHILSGRRSKMAMYSNAVVAFKSAFAPEIADISNDSYSIDVFPFAEAYYRHMTAVDTIRPILPARYQRKLQKAWDEYRGKDNKLGMDDEEFIRDFSATITLEDKTLFNDFEKRFNNLHSCLDELL